VQLAGEPVSLLQRRLALELAEQLRVVDGDRHLVGHRGEEVGVGIGGVVCGRVEHAEHSQLLVTGDQRSHCDGVPGSLRDRFVHRLVPGVPEQLLHVTPHRRPMRLERLQARQGGTPLAALLDVLQVVVAMPGRSGHPEGMRVRIDQHDGARHRPRRREHVSGHPVQHLLQ